MRPSGHAELELAAAPIPGQMDMLDPAYAEHADPCPDCGRRYLEGEHVAWRVPTRDGGARVAWSGCCDCWVRRTDPAAVRRWFGGQL